MEEKANPGFACLREKGRDMTQSMTKAHKPTEKSKKQHDNTKSPPKLFDYTMIADRLRAVSWSNNSHPTGVVKPVKIKYGLHLRTY